MSYRIIEQHGGRIECDSGPDVGIEFVILLPRFTEEAVEITEPPGGPHTVVSEDRPRSILFIDDEAFVRAVGEGILKHHGYTVICATTDQEGMATKSTSLSRISPCPSCLEKRFCVKLGSAIPRFQCSFPVDTPSILKRLSPRRVLARRQWSPSPSPWRKCSAVLRHAWPGQMPQAWRLNEICLFYRECRLNAHLFKEIS